MGSARYETSAVTRCKLQMSQPASRVPAHDVFISYSAADRERANAVCRILESDGVQCWMAPRDIPAGAKWDEAIIDGIDSSRMLLLLYSRSSMQSAEVEREVVHASRGHLPVLPI